MTERDGIILRPERAENLADRPDYRIGPMEDVVAGIRKVLGVEAPPKRSFRAAARTQSPRVGIGGEGVAIQAGAGDRHAAAETPVEPPLRGRGPRPGGQARHRLAGFARDPAPSPGAAARTPRPPQSRTAEINGRSCGDLSVFLT